MKLTERVALTLNGGRRGLGLRGPDSDPFAYREQGKQDWSFETLNLKKSEEKVGDLSRYVMILDQLSTSSCVANACEGAVLVERRILGYPDVMGSRLFGYSNARALHGDSSRRSDSGTYLRNYMWALKKSGSCPEEIWPFDISKVNKSPPARAYQAAYAMRGIRGYFKLNGRRRRWSNEVRDAITAGKPVVFGTMVESSFGEEDGPVVVGPPKPEHVSGGHAMMICGFRFDPKLGWLFKVANSWGINWRDGGFFWMTEEYLECAFTTDLWVVSLV